MTLKLAGFNAVTTAYLVLGSLHEESRLRAAYGSAYRAYQRSGVPFYLPWPPEWSRGDDPTQKILANLRSHP